MHLPLRWKIIVFTALPLLVLAGAALWTVHHSVETQVQQNIHDDLRRASAVFEDMMAARSEQLAVAGLVIVQDPRFFSVLTLPGSAQEPEVQATVSGVASTFNAITQADLFEVLDAEERLLASVGAEFTNRSGREPFVRAARSGRPSSGILVDPSAHYQVSVTPVYAGGRVVGALLLGERIDRKLAERLRTLTRSDVTFFSDRRSTGSTLENEDRTATLEAMEQVARRSPTSTDGTMFQVRGPTHTYLTLARPIPRSDPGQRQVYVMQRALDVETAFLREMQTRLIELGGLVALVALLTGFLIADRITGPVQRLVRGAEEMDRGNYDYPLNVRSRDEIGYLAVRFDQMRQHQRATVKKLEEIARLKSEFINVASHELRTPISVIRGYQELMAREMMGPLTPTQKQALDAIAASAGTLSRIAEDATRMAQIEGERLLLQLDEHAVADLVSRALDGARAAAPGRSVQLTGTVDSEVGTVHVDGPRIVQALTNLVCNGIRFTPDGGSVVVSAARRENHLVLEVRDTGVGIHEDRQRELFERAFQIPDSLHHHSSSTLEFNSAGLGVGLAIARGIVEAHGGTLEVRSTVGKGSTFTIRVPAVPAARQKEAA